LPVCLWIHLLSQSGRSGGLLMEINCRVSVGLIKKNTSTRSTRRSDPIATQHFEWKSSGEPEIHSLSQKYVNSQPGKIGCKYTHFSLKTLRLGRWSFGKRFTNYLIIPYGALAVKQLINISPHTVLCVFSCYFRYNTKTREEGKIVLLLK